jgi:hypothetical protein
MVHFLIGFALGLSLMNSAFSEISLSNNIPAEDRAFFYFSDKTSTYRVKNYLGVTGRYSDQKYASAEISTLSVEFQNVQDARVNQYLNVIYDEDSNPTLIQITSFICLGQLPIGADAISIKLHKKEEDYQSEQKEEIFIATGQAGEDIQINQTKKYKSKIFDHFLNLVEEKTLEMQIHSLEPDVYIPRLLSGQLEAEERKILSTFFNETSSSINGCTYELERLMNSYKIEHLENKQMFKGIQIQRKIPSASQYFLKWKL